MVQLRLSATWRCHAMCWTGSRHAYHRRRRSLSWLRAPEQFQRDACRASCVGSRVAGSSGAGEWRDLGRCDGNQSDRGMAYRLTYRKGADSFRKRRRLRNRTFRRVEMWRGDGRPGVSVVRLFRLAVPEQLDRSSVSTSPSSNVAGGFPAPRSRTRRHAFTHDGPRPSCVRRTSPKCS